MTVWLVFSEDLKGIIVSAFQTRASARAFAKTVKVKTKPAVCSIRVQP